VHWAKNSKGLLLLAVQLSLVPVSLPPSSLLPSCLLPPLLLPPSALVACLVFCAIFRDAFVILATARLAIYIRYILSTLLFCRFCGACNTIAGRDAFDAFRQRIATAAHSALGNMQISQQQQQQQLQLLQLQLQLQQQRPHHRQRQRQHHLHSGVQSAAHKINIIKLKMIFGHWSGVYVCVCVCQLRFHFLLLISSFPRDNA